LAGPHNQSHTHGSGLAVDPRVGNALQRADPIYQEDLGVFGTHPWKIADAFQGTQIFGGTGSGKTTGSGAAIALALLKAGFGGLVLTAKADEVSRWKSYAFDCGRADDVVEISPDNGAAFNILDYEYRSGRRLTHNLVSLLLGAMTSGNESSTSDPYWHEALREMLIHAVDLFVLAIDAEPAAGVHSDRTPSQPLQLASLDRIVRTAPQSAKAIGSKKWRDSSHCWKLIERADRAARAGVFGKERARDLDATIDYWLHDYPNLASRTRSIIVSTFTAKFAGLLRSPLREMFFEATRPEFSPDASMRATRNGRYGKIIIVNLPVKTYGEVGRLAQILYKIAWTRAADRRSGIFGRASRPSADSVGSTSSALCSPAFLWADESQYFVTPEDQLFQQTARSSRVATVYLTQNIENYKAMLGRNSESAMYSLLGNLQTKIFHTNGDPATNRFAEATFGKEWTPLNSQGSNAGDSIQDGRVTLSSGKNTTISLHYVDVVTARDITLLPSGGPRYGLKVKAIVFQAGRNWNRGDGADGSATNMFVHSFDQYLG